MIISIVLLLSNTINRKFKTYITMSVLISSSHREVLFIYLIITESIQLTLYVLYDY